MGRGARERGGRRCGAGSTRGRRHLLLVAGGVAGGVAGTGCLGAPVAGLQDRGHETVTIDIDAAGVVWSGSVSFETGEGRPVSVSVERALGSRSYTLPDDIDSDGYDAIYEPIEVTVVPQQGVTESDPLAVTVATGDTSHGRARSSTVDEPATVEVA